MRLTKKVKYFFKFLLSKLSSILIFSGGNMDGGRHGVEWW